MIFMGIDNGISGAIAAIDEQNFIITCCDMPTLKDGKGKNQIDIPKLANIIRSANPDKVIIEGAHAMPGQGVSSMFTFGRTYGINLGVLTTLGADFTIVDPRVWQKVMLENTLGKDTKERSINYIEKRFGTRYTKHGQTDALCMALYAKLLTLGQ